MTMKLLPLIFLLCSCSTTRAAFYGVAHIISVGGTAAAPWAGGPLASKAIPLIPAAIPAARTNPSSQ